MLPFSVVVAIAELHEKVREKYGEEMYQVWLRGTAELGLAGWLKCLKRFTTT